MDLTVFFSNLLIINLSYQYEELSHFLFILFISILIVRDGGMAKGET